MADRDRHWYFFSCGYWSESIGIFQVETDFLGCKLVFLCGWADSGHGLNSREMEQILNICCSSGYYCWVVTDSSEFWSKVPPKTMLKISVSFRNWHCFCLNLVYVTELPSCTRKCLCNAQAIPIPHWMICKSSQLSRGDLISSLSSCVKCLALIT